MLYQLSYKRAKCVQKIAVSIFSYFIFLAKLVKTDSPREGFCMSPERGGIRTHGGFHLNAFQERLIHPALTPAQIMGGFTPWPRASSAWPCEQDSYYLLASYHYLPYRDK